VANFFNMYTQHTFLPAWSVIVKARAVPSILTLQSV
jgi:hypothetical protein